MILAIDPGPDESGYYYGNPWDKAAPIIDHGHGTNGDLRTRIKAGVFPNVSHVVIEDFEPWGNRTGHDVVETCRWIGRFQEVCLRQYGREAVLLKRRAVCYHLVGNGQAKKAQIRAFCIDRWGPGKAKAIGTKKRGVGPLYGLRVHEFDALALAVAYVEGLRPRAH